MGKCCGVPTRRGGRAKRRDRQGPAVIPFFFAQACSVLKNTQSELGAKRRSFGFMTVAFGRLVVPLCIFDLESVDDAPKLLLR